MYRVTERIAIGIDDLRWAYRDWRSDRRQSKQSKYPSGNPIQHARLKVLDHKARRHNRLRYMAVLTREERYRHEQVRHSHLIRLMLMICGVTQSIYLIIMLVVLLSTSVSASYRVVFATYISVAVFLVLSGCIALPFILRWHKRRRLTRWFADAFYRQIEIYDDQS